MPHFAFLFREFQADDLITTRYLAIAVLASVFGCVLLLKNRRLISFAIGIASIPGVLVAARMFWATLQFDLREYPSDQLWLGLISAAGPFLPVTIVYVASRMRTQNKSPATGQRP